MRLILHDAVEKCRMTEIVDNLLVGCETVTTEESVRKREEGDVVGVRSVVLDIIGRM